MIKTMKWLAGFLLAATLAACGGGGGSAGGTGPSAGAGGSGGTAQSAKIVLSLTDSSGAAIAGNAVTQGTPTLLKATLTDATGLPVPNKLVVFSETSPVLFSATPSTQVLTNASGVATIVIAPVSFQTSGAGTITASATVGATPVAGSIDLQAQPAQVAVSNLVPNQSSLTAFQSTGVSVDAIVNGKPGIGVNVNFQASCGSFTPASAVSDSSGKARSTFQASGCTTGTATLFAFSGTSAAATSSVSVQGPTPTNLLFVSATPASIVSSVASFGIKQSTVVFQVVDASGAPITAPTDVQVALSTSAIASGVVFADTNSTAPKTVSTDANGKVSVIVKSGSVPTPLSLTATLVSNPTITAASAGLSVNSGTPSQAFFSMSAESFNIEGWQVDNVSTAVNVLVADRLGQPVPAGTPITFVTEGGQVTASCLVVIDANNKSGCSVSLVSQAFRPANGRVTVLAYTQGEEAFIDANGNNQYDPGETFYDMGQPFLDANENGTYDIASEQKIGNPATPGSGIGTSSCPAHQFQVASVAGTCDGAWGQTLVRGQLVIAFSTSSGTASFAASNSTTLNLVLSDLNGNAMPSGSTVSAAVQGGTNCSLDQVIPAIVPSTPDPTFHSVLLKAGSSPGDTCSGAQVTVKVTTPKNVATLLGVVTMP